MSVCHGRARKSVSRSRVAVTCLSFLQGCLGGNSQGVDRSVRKLLKATRSRRSLPLLSAEGTVGGGAHASSPLSRNGREACEQSVVSAHSRRGIFGGGSRFVVYAGLKGVNNACKDRPEQEPLNCIVGGSMPSLHPLSQSTDYVNIFEHTVQKAGTVAGFVRRGGGLEHYV